MKKYLFLIALFPLLAVSETNGPTAKNIALDSDQEQQEALSPAENSLPIEESLFLVETENGSGSAFLFEDDDGVWLVSNSHVFEGGTTYDIKNSAGTIISVPTNIQMAAHRDLIRFKTPFHHGLCSAKSCTYDEEIFAFGNSGGAGVMARLEGKVLGLGSDRVEISSEIIPGNSGGPVVNKNNEVIGVATYLLNPSSMPDWAVKGTRFEEPRRMALKIDGAEWIETSIEEYHHNAKNFNEVTTDLHTLIAITTGISSNLSANVLYEIENDDIREWLKKHNRLTRKIRGTRISIFSSSAGRKLKSINRSIKRNLEDLAEVVEELEDDADNLNRVSLPFFEDRLLGISRTYKNIREQLELIAEN